MEHVWAGLYKLTELFSLPHRLLRLRMIWTTRSKVSFAEEKGGAYALLLEKPGLKAKAYVGSGSAAQIGVSSQFDTGIPTQQTNQWQRLGID